jgi:hypothetical protein
MLSMTSNGAWWDIRAPFFLTAALAPPMAAPG